MGMDNNSSSNNNNNDNNNEDVGPNKVIKIIASVYFVMKKTVTCIFTLHGMMISKRKPFPFCNQRFLRRCWLMWNDSKLAEK